MSYRVPHRFRRIRVLMLTINLKRRTRARGGHKQKHTHAKHTHTHRVLLSSLSDEQPPVPPTTMRSACLRRAPPPPPYHTLAEHASPICVDLIIARFDEYMHYMCTMRPHQTPPSPQCYVCARKMITTNHVLLHTHARFPCRF